MPPDNIRTYPLVVAAGKELVATLTHDVPLKPKMLPLIPVGNVDEPVVKSDEVADACQEEPL